jgi:hypothetical protein
VLDGLVVGNVVGNVVGLVVGNVVGNPDGLVVGNVVGKPDGAVDGKPDGAVDGNPDGLVDGNPDGAVDGPVPLVPTQLGSPPLTFGWLCIALAAIAEPDAMVSPKAAPSTSGRIDVRCM